MIRNGLFLVVGLVIFIITLVLAARLSSSSPAATFEDHLGKAKVYFSFSSASEEGRLDGKAEPWTPTGGANRSSKGCSSIC